MPTALQRPTQQASSQSLRGKIRVRTSTWDQEVVILADQALEIVALGKSLRLVRAPRPLEYLDYDPLGFADAGYGAVK
jgi:hypothetical protein